MRSDTAILAIFSSRRAQCCFFNSVIRKTCKFFFVICGFVAAGLSTFAKPSGWKNWTVLFLLWLRFWNKLGIRFEIWIRLLSTYFCLILAVRGSFFRLASALCCFFILGCFFFLFLALKSTWKSLLEFKLFSTNGSWTEVPIRTVGIQATTGNPEFQKQPYTSQVRTP